MFLLIRLVVYPPTLRDFLPFVSSLHVIIVAHPFYHLNVQFDHSQIPLNDEVQFVRVDHARFDDLPPQQFIVPLYFLSIFPSFPFLPLMSRFSRSYRSISFYARIQSSN